MPNYSVLYNVFIVIPTADTQEDKTSKRYKIERRMLTPTRITAPKCFARIIMCNS